MALLKPTLIFSLLMVTHHFWLFGQNLHILGKNSAWSLEGTIIRSPGSSHTKSYPESSDAYAYFSPTTSFEGRVTWQKFIGRQTGISAGLTMSAYPFTLRSFANKKFTNHYHDLDFFPGRFGIQYGGPYLELRPGISRYYKIGDKLFLSPEVNLNLVYFIPSYLNVSFAVIDTTNFKQRTVFSSHTDYNPDGKIFLTPELSLNVSYRIGKRLLLISKCFVKYSNKNVLRGTYQIIGETEILEGSFSKKYAAVGASLGLILLSKT